MKTLLKKIIEVAALFIEDILIFAGIFMINFTTYKVNLIAGLYVTGVTFLLLGFYFAKNPVKKRG